MKMSTSKGNTHRTRAQKHQNKSVFKNDLHDTSKKTKLLNSLEVAGVCVRCKEIIEWKIKYKKYKPLTSPKKCVGCEQKSIKYAYHVLCTQCSKDKNVCSKCCKPLEAGKPEIIKEDNKHADITSMLKGLPERKRRTILRYIKKQEDQENTIESVSQVENILSKLGLNEECDTFSSDDYDSDSI